MDVSQVHNHKSSTCHTETVQVKEEKNGTLRNEKHGMFL